jgi:hypothetical protein
VARDVEFTVTASDKTGVALASAEAKFKTSQDRIRRESDKTGEHIGRGMTDGVGRAGPRMASTVSSMLAQSASVALPVMVGALIGAGPLIGATISGAVIGAAGAGGVVGGLVLAARDTTVQTAYTALASDIGKRLDKAGGAFVGPALEGIRRIDAALDTIDFEGILANASKFEQPLVNGIGIAIERVGDGVEDLISRAGPVINAIGQGLAQVGDAIGDVFTDLSDDGVSAATAISQAFAVGETVIRTVGKTVEWLTNLYGFLAKGGAFGTEIQGQYLAMEAAARQAGQATQGAADGIQRVGEKATGSAAEVGAFTEQINQTAAAGRGLFDATTNTADAMDRVTAAAKKNGATLDEHTEKGRANRQALSNLAGALHAQYTATVQVNGEGVRSNAVANENRAAFIRLAQQFGASRRQAEALANSMGLIPAKKNTNFEARTAAAQARVRDLKRLYDQVQNKTVTVDVYVNASRLNAVENRLERLHGGAFATGQTWAATDQNSGGMSRTSAPTAVNLTSTNRLYLDGTLVYERTERQIEASNRRQAHRAKVGRR